MMRKLSIYFGLCLLFLGGVSKSWAQQESLFSQYMFNRLMINPAYAGCKENVSVTGLYRHQWTGFDGAPKTFTISGHGSLMNMKMGVGGYIYSDWSGPLRETRFGAQYAYRIRLGEANYLSFGLSASLVNYAINKGDITTHQPNDPVFAGGTESSIRPDFGFGIFFNSRTFYAGLSTQHLIEMNMGLSGYDNSKDNRMSRHYLLTTGVDIRLGNSLILTPSINARYVYNAPFSLDVNANLMFIQTFWVGAGWRTSDAVVFMAGVYPFKKMRVGYAYDLGYSSLRSVHSGSHEIMLSFEFGDPNKSRVVTPRYF